MEQKVGPRKEIQTWEVFLKNAPFMLNFLEPSPFNLQMDKGTMSNFTSFFYLLSLVNGSSSGSNLR